MYRKGDIRWNDGTAGRRYCNVVINSHVVECIKQTKNKAHKISWFPVLSFIQSRVHQTNSLRQAICPHPVFVCSWFVPLKEYDGVQMGRACGTEPRCRGGVVMKGKWKRNLGRPTCRWKTLKWILKKLDWALWSIWIGRFGLNWIERCGLNWTGRCGLNWIGRCGLN